MPRKIIVMFLMLIANPAIPGSPLSGQVTAPAKGYLQTSAYGQGESHYKTNWNINPFPGKVFIENKGQFDLAAGDGTNEKIFFMADLGRIKAYFTSRGIVYRFDKFKEREKNEAGDEKEELEREKREKPEAEFFSEEWGNSNLDVKPIPESENSFPYIYASEKVQTINAHAFHKIIYKDLYPGVDAVYYFLKDKPGIKYDLIVHPGADLSNVQLQYKDAKKISVNENGEVIITTEMGEFTSHVPKSFYKEGKAVYSRYILKGKKIFFDVTNTDPNKTLIIDPWTTNPNMTNSGWGPNTNAAYDVDYDNLGNVYAYGSYFPFLLVKLNAAGVIQWTFSVPYMSQQPLGTFSQNYGDFAVDHATGTSYLVEGVGTGTGGGARALKVNTSGSLVNIFQGNPQLMEMWRMAFDQCSHSIVIGGGGMTVTNQACMLDTTMNSITPVNVLGANQGFHDMSVVAIDPAGGTCYMATNKSNVNGGSYDNVLLKLPVPSLAPTAYQVYDGYPMHEGYINGYILGPVSIGNPNSFCNGFNGMAASQNWVYMHDGTILTRYNKNTGTTVASISTYNWNFFFSRDTIRWGGLDVDECENIYAGVEHSIKVYNSTLTQTQTINVADTIMDLKLGGNNNLYACGKGFVSSMTITGGNVVTFTMTKQDPASCSCTGTATANFTMTCGSTSNLNYSWSTNPVQTAQTATGLCPGTYTVTVSSPSSCNKTYSDTITLVAPPGSLNAAITSVVNSACTGNTGSATANATGGNSPYTFLWSNGQTAQTATGLSAGSYTLVITDASGCTASLTVNITGSNGPMLQVSSQTNVLCSGGNNGSASVTITGGVGPYSYSWTTNPIQTNSTATGLSAATYTIEITDANGCTSLTSVTITEPPPLLAAISNGTGQICVGQNIILQSTVTGGTSAYSYLWSTNQNTNSITVSPSSTTSYTLVVTDANGCTAAVITAIIISPIPQVNLSANDTTACGKLCVNFTTSSIGNSFSWNFGDGGTSNLQNPVHCYTAPGIYSVSLTVTNAGGCSAVFTHPNYIQVFPEPIAAFSATPTLTSILNSTIVFTDLSAGATNWNWTFGDLQSGTSQLENPSYTYNDTGFHHVILIVTNQYGCADTASTDIRITEEFSFYAPNAFTPNGDGNNDYFSPQGIDVDESRYHLWIFDRWGNMIFETTRWGQGWDGRANGGKDIAQIDVYVWKADVYSKSTNFHKMYIGHVSLIK